MKFHPGPSVALLSILIAHWTGPANSSAQVPNFAHPERPHLMLKNPFAPIDQIDQLDTLHIVRQEQRVLTVLMEFPDSPHTPEHGIDHFNHLMYEWEGSVSNYFREVSYGSFGISNAGITDWVLAPREAAYYFDSLQVDAQYGLLAADAVKQLLDTGFTFNGFDRDSDGVVTRDELVIVLILADHRFLPQPNLMATREVQGIKQGVTQSDGLEIDTWAARVEENLPVEGWAHEDLRLGSFVSYYAHEMCHLMLALPDLYGDDFGGDDAGLMSLMSTAGLPASPHISPWAKIHLGWIEPIIVTKSGYYSIEAVESAPVAYLLYDPLWGQDEYYIIENRWPPSSSQEKRGPPQTQYLLPDAGLSIWHITEYYDEEPFNFFKGRKMIATKWAGGDDAWTDNPPTFLWDCSDPKSCYDFTDDSAPRDARWADGTGSGIEIREISAAGPTMGVYFYVPNEILAPRAPTLMSPEDRATGVEIKPTLVFSTVASADRYRVQVSKVGDFSDTVIDDDSVQNGETPLPELEANQNYFWRVLAENDGGTSQWSPSWRFTTGALSTRTAGGETPIRFSVSAYPNPFATSTTIAYAVPSPSFVTITVFDVLGRELRQVVAQPKQVGMHEIELPGKGLPMGTLLLRIRVGDQAMTSTLILAR